ncbi:MAG TPA: tetratricopeptide repeat protein [Candidatus Polarisedimenticolaceae bacterium]|nr:tetratricopeptide repeat protein [Candidatus Polarisedimenticolaceae bacterium]
MSAPPALPRRTWSFLVIVAVGVAGTVATYFARLPTGARGYYNRGVADSREGRLDSAIRNLDHALELEPERFDAHIARGMTWLRAGRPYAALTDADAALKVAPTAVRAHYLRGLAWLRAGREDQALASFRHAVEADPGFGRAVVATGDLAFDRGRPDDALEAYRRACALRHDDDAMHYVPMLVWATRLLAGDRTGAESELRELIRKRPLDRFRLASWVDAATRVTRGAAPARGEEGVVLAWTEGVRDLAAGDRAGAVGHFRRAIAEGAPDSWAGDRARAMLESVTVGFRVALENREISSSFSFGPGVEVTCVRADGPAARAGITEGDRLVRIGGADASSEGVDAVVTREAVGRELALQLFQRGRPIDVALVVGGGPPR